MVEGLLAVVAKDIELLTSATKVRCSIMLPTGGDTHIVVYQHGMNGQPDVDFEVNLTAGWSGRARVTRRTIAAALTQEGCNLSANEKAKIPIDRKAALSIPLFDVSSSIDGKIDADNDSLLGTLNIDTEKTLYETSWGSESATAGRDFDFNEAVGRRCQLWGEVFSRLLS
jgi:NTE family protein